MRDKECTEIAPKTDRQSWQDFYPKWGTRRGNAIRVLPKVFLGMFGWHRWVDKRIVDGVTYLGEVWMSENENGDLIKTTFRVPYSEDADDLKYIVRSKFTTLIKEGFNYHTDGIQAYETKDIKHITRDQLKNHNVRFRNRIFFLKEWFNSLNNINDPQLRLGIQLYLRRLQTPCLQTSREWKNFKNSNNHGETIISSLQQKDLM